MLDREQLRLRLEQIAENHYALPEGDNALNYLEPMLTYIGDTEAYLRDELICTVFYKWIGQWQYFDDGALCAMLHDLIGGKYLFYHIGNDGDDTVYTRSFSMLVVAQILAAHKQRRVLDQALFEQVKAALFQYFVQEMDFRGFVPEYGWAHAAAHGADALVELVQCDDFNLPDLMKALDCMKRVLQNGRYIFYYEEDERLACVLIAMQHKYPSLTPDLQAWLEELKQMDETQEYMQRYMTRINTKQFVRSLYFRLLHRQDSSVLVKALETTEKCLNRFA